MTTRALSVFYLQTKLQPPRELDFTVDRPDLWAKLDRGVELPLTLVCAPAGYGKSRVVAQWLSRLKRPTAWLSLDKGDAELRDFVGYFAAALQQGRSQALPNIGALLDTLDIPQPTAIADLFLHDLEALPEPLFFVLDDYHTVENPAVQSFMQRLIQRASPQLRLIIITRSDPILPLARLRADGRLNEIRNADLRFRPEEAQQLIDQLAGSKVDARTAAELHILTEGWAVGLQLAGVLLHAAVDYQTFTRNIAHSSHSWIMEYFLDEVLAQLDEAHRALLLHASLLNRFCGDLLQAVMDPALERNDGAEHLAFLLKANLFLVPLDESGTWYRFHHLFQKVLRHRFEQDDAAELRRQVYRRASAWHEAQDMIDAAIEYCLVAEEEEQAMRLVESNLYRALNEEEWRRIERWLTRIPMTANAPAGPLIVQAYLEHFRHRVDSVAPLLDQAERALESAILDRYTPAQRAAWRGAIAVLRAQDRFFAGDPKACIDYVRIAQEKLPSDWTFLRGLSDFYYIYGHQNAGQLQEAISYGHMRLAQEISPPNSMTLRIFLGLSATHYDMADTYAAERISTTFRRVATDLRQNISIGWACFLCGWARAERNELAAAEEDFRTVIHMRHLVHMRAAIDSFTSLALARAGQGNFSFMLQLPLLSVDYISTEMLSLGAH